MDEVTIEIRAIRKLVVLIMRDSRLILTMHSELDDQLLRAVYALAKAERLTRKIGRRTRPVHEEPLA